MSRITLATAVACLALLASSTQAYEHHGNHYSISAPTGWSQESPDEANRLAKGSPGAPRYDAMFKQAGSTGVGSPYVLVQFEEKVATLEEFEADLDRMKSSRAGMPPNVTIRSANVDTDRKRAIIEMDIKGPAGQTLRCRTYSMLGSEAMVHVHCYAQQPASAALVRCLTASPMRSSSIRVTATTASRRRANPIRSSAVRSTARSWGAGSERWLAWSSTS